MIAAACQLNIRLGTIHYPKPGTLVLVCFAALCLVAIIFVYHARDQGLSVEQVSDPFEQQANGETTAAHAPPEPNPSESA